MTCQNNAGQNHNMKVANNGLQVVAKFKSFGTEINK
jgi:hypothetical protein